MTLKTKIDWHVGSKYILFGYKYKATVMTFRSGDLYARNSSKEVRGNSSLSQFTWGERQNTPWTGRSLSRDNNTYRESPIHRTCMAGKETYRLHVA